MKRSLRISLVVLLISVVPIFAGGNAYGQIPRLDGGSCQPGLAQAFQANSAAYSTVYNALVPNVPGLTTQLSQVVNQTTYQVLLNAARFIASTIPNGRMVIALPDGTVVLDTTRPDDPTNVLPVGNSFQHFTNKTVNENHNSRVAIFSAQQYPCG